MIRRATYIFAAFVIAGSQLSVLSPIAPEASAVTAVAACSTDGSLKTLYSDTTGPVYTSYKGSVKANNVTFVYPDGKQTVWNKGVWTETITNTSPYVLTNISVPIPAMGIGYPPYNASKKIIAQTWDNQQQVFITNWSTADHAILPLNYNNDNEMNKDGYVVTNNAPANSTNLDGTPIAPTGAVSTPVSTYGSLIPTSPAYLNSPGYYVAPGAQLQSTDSISVFTPAKTTLAPGESTTVTITDYVEATTNYGNGSYFISFMDYVIGVPQCNPVVPASPVQAIVCNRNNDTFTMPTIDTSKVTLTDTGWANGSRTFTYTPATGYPAFSDGTKSKQYVFKDAGDACPVTTPAPTAPVVGPCEFGVAGQTIRKQVSSDVDVRTKVGSGGETNADSWGTTFRLYGATDTAITNMTFTATAMEGMVFVPGTIGAVATGDNNPATDQGALGALDNNGYDATATSIGTPTLSADSKTITLTIANMPAKTPFAFTVNVTPDASGATMVINETMTADQASCPGSISGTTFWDNNLSFSLDSGDTAYGGKTVYLLDADGATIASTVTAADGTYSFSDVPEGTYQVATLTVSGEALTLSHFSTITVGRAQAVTDIDFGFAKTYPVIHNTMPSLAKVDQNANPLSGAAVTGFSCTRWDNDINWQCQDLADYGTIDPNLRWDFLIQDIPMRYPKGDMTVDYPSDHRLIMWEKSAPAGYTITPKTYAVEYRCGAWRILNVTDRTAEALAAAPETTCDSPILFNNTFLWVNTIIGGKGGVVEPPVTPAAPATATELPHTGPATPRDARGILLALIAGVITYGAVYFAQSRRLYE